MPAKRKADASAASTANLGFEAKTPTSRAERDSLPQAARRGSAEALSNTKPRTSSGCPPMPAGPTSRPAPSSLPSGFVSANGAMSSNQSGEGEIRRAIIEDDLVDCIVALPGQLFYSTQIPVGLWFLTKNKKANAKSGFRDRRKQTLFIDARKMGTLIDRVHRELTDADLEKITATYHAWRGDSSTKNQEPGTKNPTAAYADVAGFCKSATTAEIAAHGHVLTPGRYVGAEEVEDDGDPFEEKMPRLVAELHAQFAESAKLEAAIRANLKSLNFTP